MRSVNADQVSDVVSKPLCSKKEKKNAHKKFKRARNRINRLASYALESGSVINLTDQDIPPEALAVLAKSSGFVPTGSLDPLQNKVDLSLSICLQRVTRSVTRVRPSGRTSHRVIPLHPRLQESETFCVVP